MPSQRGFYSGYSVLQKFPIIFGDLFPPDDKPLIDKFSLIDSAVESAKRNIPVREGLKGGKFHGRCLVKDNTTGDVRVIVYKSGVYWAKACKCKDGCHRCELHYGWVKTEAYSP